MNSGSRAGGALVELRWALGDWVLSTVTSPAELQPSMLDMARRITARVIFIYFPGYLMTQPTMRAGLSHNHIASVVLQRANAD
jgi:hypothetical protein